MAEILVVEDDNSIRNLIIMTLAINNYHVTEASDGAKAYDLLHNKKYDLVLLDVMLPEIDGFQIMQSIDHKIPVIFLTAKISIADKVFGLKLGADDYITKPFEPMELLARVEAVLRRTYEQNIIEKENADDGNELTFKNFTVNLNEHIVFNSQNQISLTPKEFELLIFLIKNKNQVFSREQLLNQIWGYDYYGGTRTVDMHIKQLRQKLDIKEELETVFKVGYKLKG